MTSTNPPGGKTPKEDFCVSGIIRGSKFEHGGGSKFVPVRGSKFEPPGGQK